MKSPHFPLLASGMMLLLFFSCTGQSMPLQRPPDLIIEMHQSGGMLPESDHWYICADSAYKQSFSYSYRNRHTFTPKAEKLDTLWAFLREQDAINVRSENRGEIMDRGGSSMWIRYSGENFNISNAGNMFIKKNDRDAWREVYTATGKFIADGLLDQVRELDIVILYADSIPDIRFLTIQVDRFSVATFNKSDTTDLPRAASRELMPGTYRLRVQVDFEDDRKFYSSAVQIVQGPNLVTLTITPEGVLRTGGEPMEKL